MTAVGRENTAAPISLIPLGSQRIRVHADFIHRTTNPPTPSIQDVCVHHRDADMPMVQEFLEGPDVVTVVEQVRERRIDAAGDGLARGNGRSGCGRWWIPRVCGHCGNSG
jgi:hypothetical protein